MFLISTFEHSINLEKALTALQMKGIAKENILCIPMDKRGEERQLFDTMQLADGLSLLDFPVFLATIFCLFGGIYGFTLTWGPIAWGLICMVLGFAVGLGIKFLTTKKYMQHRQKNLKLADVAVIIDCTDDQINMVKELLWQHYALTIGRVSLK